MSGPIRFLLVDDVPENLVALEALLRREALEIDRAPSGPAALELLLQHDYALAFIDVNMPEMDGFELAELMRGAERSKHVPIIFVTAGSREPQRMFRGYESGAVDFLYKPIDPLILRHKAETFYQLSLQRRQLAEQMRRARESEALLRGVMDATTAMIRVKDLEGRYLFANRVCRRLQTIGGRPLLGHRDEQLFTRELTAQLAAHDRQALAAPTPVEFEEQLPQADGVHTYISSTVPLRDREGRVQALCTVSTDISERKRLELDLAQALRMREDLLAIVSHDLRNPLQVIAMTAETLRRRASDECDDRLQQQGEMLARAVTRMDRLIGDLLDMAQLRGGRLSITPAPQDLPALLAEVLAAHESTAAASAISLRLSADPALPVKLYCDRERLLQVFSNLIGNALKFCPAGASVTVCAHCDCELGRLRFGVIDNGPGIAAADLPMLFEPYWSAGERRSGSVGLGLFIAKGIVEAHDGRMWAESEPGGGAALWFELPLDAAAESQAPA